MSIHHVTVRKAFCNLIPICIKVGPGKQFVSLKSKLHEVMNNLVAIMQIKTFIITALQD